MVIQKKVNMTGEMNETIGIMLIFTIVSWR